MELARRIIGEREAMERELGHAMWAVEDKTTGAFVGQRGLRRSMREPGRKSISHTTTPGRVGTRDTPPRRRSPPSANGLGPVSLAAIMAVVVPENSGSWRVMEEAGIRYQGLVDHYGMEGLKKYIATREWRRSPLAS